MIIDSHCHLNYIDDSISLDDVLTNAKLCNIELLLNISTKSSDFDDLIKTSATYDQVYFTLGIHPHEANEFNEKTSRKIYDNVDNQKFIGIGEMGLDYFYNYSDKSAQILAFEKQIEISQDLDIPLIVHMRDAEDDTLKIFRNNFKKKSFNGVIHCFTGSQKFADEVIEMGFYISASGIITFKKSENLRNIFSKLPNDKILVETDSPYLSPEPLRSKRNQPSHIVHTIKKLAEIRNTNYDDLAAITKKNFLTLFKRI
tara:strand:- start:1349 stop:2119 length:771 start_codon:yes stop_codon:yes gene_type:complete